MSDRLTISQVAARFGVNKSAVRKWVYARKLPAVRTLGGQWRFDPDDVAAYTPARQPGHDRGCEVQGCDRPHHARGLCRRDYKRARRPGGAFDLDDSGEL